MHLTRSSTRVKSLGLVDKIDVLYITSGFFWQFSVQNQRGSVADARMAMRLAFDPHDSEQICWD
jgi:hypothetical protein